MRGVMMSMIRIIIYYLEKHMLSLAVDSHSPSFIRNCIIITRAKKRADENECGLYLYLFETRQNENRDEKYMKLTKCRNLMNR